MNKVYLPIENYCDRKSFYGKCEAWRDEEKKSSYVRSYSTIVCVFVEGDGFHRTWGGYSATTMRHVNAFVKLLGFWNGWQEDGSTVGGKQWWDTLPVEDIRDFM